MEKTEKKKKREIRLMGYTIGEEIFNSVSHGVGALLSAAGCALLVVFAVIYGDGVAIASAAIYGTTLIIMYLMSTLYHSIPNKTTKKVFRVLDHSSIYLLIAGTYTPYTLIALRGNGYPAIGWALFGIVWGGALIGIVLNSISLDKFHKFSLGCYLVMGWVAIAAIRPLMNILDFAGLFLLFFGGAMYTLGVTFFVLTKYKYMHSIWHLFVMGGSVSHFFSILLSVVIVRY